MSFICELCKFKTKLSANYNQHIATKKHIRLHDVSINATMNKPRINHEKPRIAHEKTTKNHEFQTALNEPIIDINTLHKCKYCDKNFKQRNSMYHHIKYTCKQNKDEDLIELVRLLNLQLEQQRAEAELYKDTDVSHLTDADYRKSVNSLLMCV